MRPPYLKVHDAGQWIPGYFTMHPNGGGWVSKNSYIHPSASIAPTSSIADGTTVGSDTQIGPRVAIGSSKVGARVAIAGTESPVEWSSIIDCVISDDVQIGKATHLRDGVSVAQGVTIPDYAFITGATHVKENSVGVLASGDDDWLENITVICDRESTRVQSRYLPEPITLEGLSAYAYADQRARFNDFGTHDYSAQLLAICNLLREWSSLPSPQRTQEALDALSAKLPPLEPFKPNPEPQVLYYDNPHHPKDFKLLTRFTAAVPPQTADRLAQDWNLCHQLASTPSVPPPDITLGPHYLGDEHEYLTLLSALTSFCEGACLNPAEPVTEEQHSMQGLLLRASRATQPHPAQLATGTESNPPIIRFAALNNEALRGQALMIQAFFSRNFRVPEDQYLHRLKHFYFVTDIDNKVTNPVDYHDMVAKSHREQDLLTRLVDDRWTLICIELGETAPTTPNYVDLSDLRGW